MFQNGYNKGQFIKVEEPIAAAELEVTLIPSVFQPLPLAFFFSYLRANFLRASSSLSATIFCLLYFSILTNFSLSFNISF